MQLDKQIYKWQKPKYKMWLSQGTDCKFYVKTNIMQHQYNKKNLCKTHSKQDISERQQATLEADLNTSETQWISTTETAA